MKRLLGCLIASLFVTQAHAADLMQIYREAQENDPTFAAARATLEAGREKSAQGLAGLLPSLSVSGNTSWNENKITAGTTTISPNYNTNGYQISLSQPIFRWQNIVAYNQSRLQVVQAEATYAQARQDLILRVAQAYFDVLYASENLAALRANKSSIAQQLELARKSFEVGTATITDTHEAQARFDLASAQEIVAESEFELRKRALEVLIGKEAGPLAAPRKDARILPPEPADMSRWIEAAESDSLAVQVQQAIAEIADKEVSRQSAGHLPTLDLVANKGNNKSVNSFTGAPFETEFNNVGLQLNIPLFQGGAVISRQREAAANRNAAQSGLESSKRNAALATRQYYLGVVNGLAQIKALKAARESSLSALESNKLGYEVGVRINIDVLNAENQVYTARRDLAKATFDTLMAQLRLRAAVGSLGDADLEQINALLDPASAQ